MSLYGLRASPASDPGIQIDGRTHPGILLRHPPTSGLQRVQQAENAGGIT